MSLDPTRQEIETLIEQVLDVCTSVERAPDGAPISQREKVLSTAVLLIDRYMRHGGQLPKRWAERRTKCRVIVGGHRCALELGHYGGCEV